MRRKGPIGPYILTKATEPIRLSQRVIISIQVKLATMYVYGVPEDILAKSLTVSIVN